MTHDIKQRGILMFWNKKVWVKTGPMHFIDYEEVLEIKIQFGYKENDTQIMEVSSVILTTRTIGDVYVPIPRIVDIDHKVLKNKLLEVVAGGERYLAENEPGL
jgi:hypothetical protein